MSWKLQEILYASRAPTSLTSNGTLKMSGFFRPLLEAKMSSKNIDFGSDLGLKLGVMRLNLGFPVVFDQKEGHVLKCLVFFDPIWRPK